MNSIMKSYSNKGFTLVELTVAITILSIIMISVIFIFVNSSQLSSKIDINRALQENSKNIIETISEDLRKNDLRECLSPVFKGCLGDSAISVGNELWIGDNHYYLGKKNLTLGEYIKVDDMAECTLKQCFILKNGQILSNSLVMITNLEFSIIKEHVPRIQINMLMKPMTGKGVNLNLIKNSELNLQTTLSEEYLKN